MPVVAWGGGSGTQGGAVPVNGGLVIDLRGLDRIIEIDERSMTVTAQAGVNGNVLERALNERGLMLPHYPASSEWATVGGYIAARGSGVLCTRYGKIEDLVLSLRVALRERRADRDRQRPAPRRRPGAHAAVRRLGGHARDHHPRDAGDRPAARRAPLRDACSSRTSTPAWRRSGARCTRGHRPSVIRMYDEEATRRTLSPVVEETLDGVCAVVCFEGEPAAVAAEGARTVELARAEGARELDPALAQRWWDRRYEFYKPPHHPELPAIWGTIDVVASYARIGAVHQALQTAVRDRYAPQGLQLRMHFSHWYRWGTMIYARFLIPDGGPDAAALHDRIWEDGITAVLEAGGVMNDHHGVGLKLAPVHEPPARRLTGDLARDQVRVRSSRHHEPRQAGAVRRRAMKVSMHNWMRPEPIEHTIERLARLGYDGIEISGEPQRLRRRRTCAGCSTSTGWSAGAR